MQTQLTIRHTSNYGNDAYYPNCAQSHNVARIAGTKTLTESCLKLLMKMGFQIIVETKLGNSFISAPLPADHFK
jgi:hypothetical protein